MLGVVLMLRFLSPEGVVHCVTHPDDDGSASLRQLCKDHKHTGIKLGNMKQVAGLQQPARRYDKGWQLLEKVRFLYRPGLNVYVPVAGMVDDWLKNYASRKELADMHCFAANLTRARDFINGSLWRNSKKVPLEEAVFDPAGYRWKIKLGPPEVRVTRVEIARSQHAIATTLFPPFTRASLVPACVPQSGGPGAADAPEVKRFSQRFYSPAPYPPSWGLCFGPRPLPTPSHKKEHNNKMMLLCSV